MLTKKINEKIEEEEDYEYLIIPPDGGWGWIVVAAAFYCNIVSDGIQLSFGVFLPKMAEYFDRPPYIISLVGSLMFGLHLCFGPICSALTNTFGLRPVTILGGVISALGLIGSYFVEYFPLLYLTYGVMGGIGFGLIYMNSIIITTLYFSKYRALAVSIVVSGTGLGTLVFSYLAHEMMEVLSWKAAFLLQSGLAGSCILVAFTFKPLVPHKVILAPTLAKQNSIITHLSTYKSFISSDSSIATVRRPIYMQTEHGPNSDVSDIGTLYKSLALEQMALDHAGHQATATIIPSSLQKNRCCRRKNKEIVVVKMAEERERFVATRGGISNRGSAYESIMESVSQAGRFTAQQSAVTKKYCECLALRSTLSNMLNFNILKTPSFIVYCVSGVIWTMGLIIVFTYEKDRSVVIGFSEQMAVYSVMVLGFSNMLWRLILGCTSIIKVFKLDYNILTAVTLFLGGSAMCLSGISYDVSYQLVCLFIFGLGLAGWAVYRPIVAVELVGVDRLSNATGISLLFQGVSAMVSPPLIGLLAEALNDYNIIFMVAGASFIVSGVMSLLIPWMRKRELRVMRAEEVEM